MKTTLLNEFTGKRAPVETCRYEVFIIDSEQSPSSWSMGCVDSFALAESIVSEELANGRGEEGRVFDCNLGYAIAKVTHE